MKRLFTLALVLCMCFAILVSAEDVKPITVTLDGAVIDCASYGQEATIVEGRTLVPLRAIFEALGASVEWNGETKTVSSVLGETEISLTIGENKLIKNGEEIALDVPAQIMNGRTLVPVRAISESFGVSVEWDGETRTVKLFMIADEPYVPADSENTDNIPAEAKETAEKFFGALLKMDMTTAAEYCTDPELLRSLNLSGYEDLFSMVGFDRESLKAAYLELLQFDPEVYGNVAEALADVSLDLYVGILEKLYCEIVSYTMVDENHIKVEYLLYAPDTSVIETLSGETVEELINLASAALASGTTEFSLETEKDIADALAALMVEYSDAVIEKKLASLEVVTDGKINEDTVINVNGTWLVECDEDDSSALSGLLENGFNFAE